MFPSLRCVTSPCLCHLSFSGMLTVSCAGCCSQPVPRRALLTSSTSCSIPAFTLSCPLGLSVTHGCSLQAHFAVSIHPPSPHILPQLPDVLTKTVLFSFVLCVGGKRKPPSGCLPAAVTSALCCIKASAQVERGLVTDLQLSMCLNALGAVALPAWPLSNSSDKHIHAWQRQG